MNLAQLKQAYETDSQANNTALREYKESKAYYHGHQLSTKTEAKILERNGIPLHENIFKMICDKILGYKIQSATEIKVSGRQEQDKALANLLTDLLRVFNQQSNFEKEMYKRDFDLLMGMAVCELWVEEDREKNKHITIKTLPTQSFLVDAYSVDKNALDATRFHKKQNISIEEAKILLDGKTPFISSRDTTDTRSFIIETWVKEYNPDMPQKYSWNRYLWHTQGGIYKTEVSPFVNNTHPFIVAKYNIDEKDNWYGLFRDIKPIQDYINYAENKMANMLGTIKALYEIDAVEDQEEFVKDISKDNAVVGVRTDALRENKIQFIQHHADIQALSMKTEQKRNLAKILSGLNDEALAMATNRQSGVAIAQRRDAGLLGLQYYVNSADNMDRLLYEKVLDFIQHYYTKEQVFRIVDKKTGERFFNINTNPSNTLKIGVFDLVYKTQLKTLGREERFMHWSEIIKAINSTRPDIVPKLLPLMLKDTDSPIVEEVEELLAQSEQIDAQNAQAQAQTQQQAQQLEIAKAQANITKDQATASKLEAQAQMLQATTASLAKEHIVKGQDRGDTDKKDLSEASTLKEVKGKMQISPSDIR
ncbi:hypothetical protein [uncultured Helicobacter sp.]|uniref:portal protein n=1 Tax=uncultured Helicobacter sp. TaxID=175537 RepID=UPI00374F1AF6